MDLFAQGRYLLVTGSVCSRELSRRGVVCVCKLVMAPALEGNVILRAKPYTDSAERIG